MPVKRDRARFSVIATDKTAVIDKQDKENLMEAALSRGKEY